ncbi:MAG TPA: GNAT family N-acetyltransferase [Acidimicrobiales bacterium]|jgi:GNAT superfamily N-acetyltransferase
MEIRPRRDDDLDRCVALATIVKQQDDYPVYIARDLRSFLAVPGALGAWVAETDPDIVGHVALHPSSGKAVMELLSETTGLGPDDVAVVSRLMVSSAARGTGVARQLLAAATGHAHSLGRQPILDVDVRTESAIILYERNGWQRLGSVTSRFPGGALDEYVYLGPAAES